MSSSVANAATDRQLSAKARASHGFLGITIPVAYHWAIGPLNVGVVGCGTIGRRVAMALDAGAVSGARLAAINSHGLERVRSFAETLTHAPDILGLQDLVEAG